MHRRRDVGPGVVGFWSGVDPVACWGNLNGMSLHELESNICSLHEPKSDALPAVWAMAWQAVAVWRGPGKGGVVRRLRGAAGQD